MERATHRPAKRARTEKVFPLIKPQNIELVFVYKKYWARLTISATDQRGRKNLEKERCRWGIDKCCSKFYSLDTLAKRAAGDQELQECCCWKMKNVEKEADVLVVGVLRQMSVSPLALRLNTIAAEVELRRRWAAYEVAFCFFVILIQNIPIINANGSEIYYLYSSFFIIILIPVFLSKGPMPLSWSQWVDFRSQCVYTFYTVVIITTR